MPTVGGAASTKVCVAHGCETLLSSQPRYCLQRGLCVQHMKADAVKKKGHEEDALWRYCQQCGKLERLDAFDGTKRSCRVQLAKRRTASFSKQASTPQSGGSSSSDTAVLRPMRAGVRKAVTCSSFDILMRRAQQQQQHAEVDSQLWRLQQQLAELEGQLGSIADQNEASSQLTLLQQHCELLASEAAALQHQQVQSTLLAANAAAMGQLGVGLACSGLGVAALAGVPGAAVPVLLAPTAAGIMPLTLPAAAAASALSGLFLPAALGMPAATLTGSAQGHLFGWSVQASSLSGLSQVTTSTLLGLPNVPGARQQQHQMAAQLQPNALRDLSSSSSSSSSSAGKGPLPHWQSPTGSPTDAATEAGDPAAATAAAAAAAAETACAAGAGSWAAQDAAQLHAASRQDWEAVVMQDRAVLHALAAGDAAEGAAGFTALQGAAGQNTGPCCTGNMAPAPMTAGCVALYQEWQQETLPQLPVEQTGRLQLQAAAVRVGPAGELDAASNMDLAVTPRGARRVSLDGAVQAATTYAGLLEELLTGMDEQSPPAEPCPCSPGQLFA